MLDDKFVAHCPDCGLAPTLTGGRKVPVREMDEYGRRGKVIAFDVYPSGCACGKSYREDAEQRPGYALNLAPSWKMLHGNRK